MEQDSFDAGPWFQSSAFHYFVSEAQGRVMKLATCHRLRRNAANTVKQNLV